MFPTVISKIISEYACEYVLLDWIKEEDLVYCELATNHHPKAVELVTSQFNEMEEVSKRYTVRRLSANPHAIDFLLDNIDYIHWEYFFANPHPDAVKISLKNLDMGHIGLLSMNVSDEAIKFLKCNPHMINWKWLSINYHPIAVELLLKNKDKIDIQVLENPSPEINDFVISKIRCTRYWILYAVYNKSPSIARYIFDKCGNMGSLGPMYAVPDIDIINELRTKLPVQWEYLSQNPVIFRDTFLDIFNIIEKIV